MQSNETAKGLTYLFSNAVPQYEVYNTGGVLYGVYSTGGELYGVYSTGVNAVWGVYWVYISYIYKYTYYLQVQCCIITVDTM